MEILSWTRYHRLFYLAMDIDQHSVNSILRVFLSIIRDLDGCGTSWSNISPLTNVLTLPIIITGGMKPEYYICKRILIFLIFNQFLNCAKTTHSMSLPSQITNLYQSAQTPVETLVNIYIHIPCHILFWVPIYVEY